MKNVVDYDALKKGYESAQKDAQDFIKNNITAGQPGKSTTVE